MRAEFVSLFEASREQMWLIAAGVTGDRSEADDVLQEAAIIALRKFAEFTPGTNFNAWMAEVTRNTARNVRRKRGRVDKMTRAFAAQAGSGEVVHARVAATERMLEAVQSLEETARMCLLLRVVGGMSYEAIAMAAQVPAGTAMSHVFRAREVLRKKLAASGMEERPEQ
jgi:RNA polymerase sigma-70 factor (ECF subfamily)